MAKAYKNIIYQKEGLICKIILNRPEALNAINTQMVIELRAAFEQARIDVSTKVVILTGSGRAFSTGRDLKEYQKYGANLLADWEMRQSGQLGFGFVRDFEKPTIAAINGFALAGGCELALACDIRIASKSAKFGLPEINFGSFPGAGATYLLPPLIGKNRALELIFTGDMIDANEAENIGLVNRVFPQDQLELMADKLAEKIASKSLPALKLAKAAVNHAEDNYTWAGMKISASLRALAEASVDRRKMLRKC